MEVTLIFCVTVQMVRLNSGRGWCGTRKEAGINWVLIDLKAPTIVRGFRTQSVMRPDGNLAFTSAVRIQVHFRVYINT
jgi:hypothetical protein